MHSEPSATSQSPGSDLCNFIFACSICCATFTDTYEGHNETFKGLSDGTNPKDRLVTRLFVSSCCHVFCVEHIEGGGPAFHPAGQKPRAPCPWCVRENGDDTPKNLFSVRGFGDDEYDPQIPSLWFTAPPVNLDVRTKEMEALRFQYLSLARYCTVSYRTRKPLTEALKSTKQQLVTMQSRAMEEHSRIMSLQRENEQLRAAAQQTSGVDALRAEIQRLQHLEQEMDQFNADLEAFRRLKADVRDLDVFRRNKAAILQYMKLLPKVIEQNTKMKERLSSLGFAMAVEPVPNHTQLTSDDLNEINSIAEAYAEDDRHFQKSSSTHTAGRSAHTSGHPLTSSNRPLKRQRVDSPLPRGMHIDPPSSRNMMPPPSKPLSRMRSVRGLIPTIRKKLSGNRSSSKSHEKKNSGDVQMYDNGNWRDAADFYGQDGRSSPHEDLGSEPPYMSGALPAEQTPQASHLPADYGQHTNASEFSFRATSPVKMTGGRDEQHAVQMPTGPSYLRLMDGLSRDDGVELGLKDPRESTSTQSTVAPTVRPPISTPWNQYQAQQADDQQRWRLGHAFLHQSPNAPLRMNDQQRTSPQERSKGFFSRAHYDPSARVPTPAPPQPQQPVRHIQNVVSSPFFGRSHNGAPHTPQLRITETQPSLHRSAVSQSQRYPTSQGTTQWRERPGLNGLSSFDAPVYARNGSIAHKTYRQPSRHTSLQTSEGGRPDIHRGSVLDSSHASSTRPLFARQHQVQSPSPAPPSFSYNRAPPSRTRQLPSSIPSIVSSHSPVRNRTQWDTLQRVGVRSSRQNSGRIPNNPSDIASVNPFTRFERRSVQR